MKRKCVAFKQSEEYPELLMPCTNLADGEGRFCRDHAKAYREIRAGLINEFHEYDKMKYAKADQLD